MSLPIISHPIIAHPETELVARVRAGDEQAFQQLFHRYYRQLCVHAGRIDRTGGSAEEIVQEVFFEVWIHRDRLQDVRTLASYLYAAVRNRALNRRARSEYVARWRESETGGLREEAATTASPEEVAEAAELAAAIDRAVAELPPRCREAFLLRRREHMSYAEIARVMGIAPKTVEIQIGKALKHLRSALAEWIRA